MREEYKKELAELKVRMEKAEKFAEKLPIFTNRIIERKITGEEKGIDFGSYYKNLPLTGGISRCFHNTTKNITNYSSTEIINKYLFHVYFNTFYLYDSHEKYGIEKLADKAFFFDSLNTTFYVEDEDIESFLNAACLWYEEAKKKAQKHKQEIRVKQLKKELRELGVEDE